MTKLFITFNIDGAITDTKGQESVVLYEWNRAMDSGYTGFNNINSATMRQKIIENLLNHVEQLFIVNTGTNILKKILGKEFIAKHKKIKVFETLKKFLAFLEQHKPNDALIIIDRYNTKHGLRETNFSSALMRLDIEIPILNSSDLFLFADDKVVFAKIFSHHPNLIPKTFVANRHNYTQLKSKIITANIDHFIIKPQQGSRSSGNIIIKKEQLSAALDTIFSNRNSKNSLSPIQRYKIKELINILKKMNFESIVIQELIIPKKLAVDKDIYYPTFRIVLTAIYDTSKNTVDIQLIDGFYKLPQRPCNTSSTLNHETLVSCHTPIPPKDFKKESDTVIFLSKEYYLGKIAEAMDNKVKAFIMQKINVSLRNIMRQFFIMDLQAYLTNIEKKDPAFYKSILKNIHRTHISNINWIFSDYLNTINYPHLTCLFLYAVLRDLKIFQMTNNPKVINFDYYQALIQFSDQEITEDAKVIGALANEISEIILQNMVLIAFLKKYGIEPQLFAAALKKYRYKPTELKQVKVRPQELTKMAVAAHRKRQYHRAISLMLQALNSYKQQRPNGKEMLICYSNLASFYRDAGFLNRAIMYCQLGIRLHNDFFPNEASKLAMKINKCKKLQQKMKSIINKYKSVDAEFIQIKKMKTGNEQIDKIKHTIADLKSIQMKIQAILPHSHQMCRCQLTIADCHQALGDNDIARNLYMASNKIAISCLGKDDHFTRQIQSKLELTSVGKYIVLN